MRLPRLGSIESSQTTVDTFKGYNHNLRIGDGEFFDMKNMTSDYYPVASPREIRGIKALYGLQNKETIDTVFYLGGRIAYIAHTVDVDGNPVDELRVIYDDTGISVISSAKLEAHSKERNIVIMGAYVVILPDKKMINSAKQYEPGDGIVLDNIEASFYAKQLDCKFYLCESNGTFYNPDKIAKGDEPPNPTNGQLWLDTVGNPTIKRWSQSTQSWSAILTNYLRVAISGIGDQFKKGDGVQVDIYGSWNANDEDLVFLGTITDGTSGNKRLTATWVVEEIGTDYLVIRGSANNPYISATGATVSITRKMPEMDFVIESGNRLWGCRYGPGNDGTTVNEIYASKLGDPTNWNCFQGVATDSYAVSIGADGIFTGAINFRAVPVFFKEGCLIEIHGAYPAQYRVQSANCRGVQKGCSKSLVILNNVLYYKAADGVCYYDGSLPEEIGYALGRNDYFDVKSGFLGDKCYMNMRDDTGAWHLFVLDVGKGIWHLEDDLQVKAFCSVQNSLLCLLQDGKTVYHIGRVEKGQPTEDLFDWMLQTGDIGIQLPEAKYVSGLIVRMLLEEGGTISFYAMYDFEEDWIHICTIPSTKLQSIELPIRPRRCDHLRLRIEGTGGAKIYSITKKIEKGSVL